MSRPHRLARVVISSLLIAVCAGQANLNTYPINWTAVPSASGPKDLTANCICDVTPFVCNPSCCCDPSCPADIVQTTRDAGKCLPEGPPEQTLDYCVAGSNVKKVNLPSSSDFYTLSVQAADDKFFDQLLCVVSSRNPNIGKQYPDPPAGASGNNANLAGCPLATSAAPRGSLYMANSPIFVRGPGSTDFSRPLTVPYPAFSMQCSDTFQPGFLMPLPSQQQSIFSECDRDTQDTSALGTTFIDLCLAANGPLSAASFTNLTFLTLPPDSTASVAPVKLQILHQDPSTGNLVDISSSSTSTSYSPTTGVCSNVLRYINISFVYSTTSTSINFGPAVSMFTLTQVQMSLVLTDLSRFTDGFQQSVRIDYVDQSSRSTTVQQLSGNPGYLSGFPLLTGSLASSTDPTLGPLTAIQRLTFGFPLPVGDASGSCSPTALAPVRFGFNSTSTCTMGLTLPALRTYCGQNATAGLAGILDGFFTELKSNNVYVGVWGNSDSNAPNQWIKVAQSNDNFATPIFYDSESTCDNVVVGYDIQVLYGVAFAANNLQRKVLYVNVCYRTSTWTFPLGQDPSLPFAFTMKSTVSFVPLPQSAGGNVKKPHPPLAIPLPEDIFYPFVTSGAASLRPVLLGGGLSVLLLSLLSVLVVIFVTN